MAVSGRQVAATLILLQVLSQTNAASLEILPNGDIQTKSIGSSHLLTCRPSVTDPNLITHIEWRDPQNRMIERLGSIQGNSKPPMYTETREGNKLVLFFNSLQEDQAGVYSCQANYANTEYLISNVTIQTIVAITWEDAPTNQYPILGEDFAIKCRVRARPSPSVDWLYNGELITTNDHFIIETHALKIKNVQESDDGIYTCRASVTTTGQLDERAIRVEVHTKPKILETDSTVEITEGQNADIQCKAIGKPPPKYSWTKSLTQQNLAIADRFGVDEDTGILTITNVNRDDAGEYECAAVNAAGRASTIIVVSVLVKPKIMEFVNVTATVQQKAVMTCKAFGRPPPEVSFRKHTSDVPFSVGAQANDDRIVLENNIDDLTGETTGILTIENLLRSDDGLYECIAHNKGGDSWKTGHLTVEFPPNFSLMKNITTMSWDQRPVNLSCIAESIPNATIRWESNGYPIDNDPQITMIGTGPVSLLTVLPIDKRYYSNYKCIATNKHGTKEYLIELREGHRPQELLQAKIADITPTTIRFELIPPPAIDLPLKTLAVQYKKSDQNWANSFNKTWALDSPYIIEGLKPETVYDFRFSAQNDAGSGNWGQYRHERTLRPSAPREPIISNKPGPGLDYTVSQFSTQFEISWVNPIDNGEPIDSYQVRCCPIERIRGTWQSRGAQCVNDIITGPNMYHQFVKDLQPNTFYQAEVRAHNIYGYSLPGIIRFKTPEDGAELPSVNAGAEALGGRDAYKLAISFIASTLILFLVS